jgi:hypothetical protein
MRDLQAMTDPLQIRRSRPRRCTPRRSFSTQCLLPSCVRGLPFKSEWHTCYGHLGFSFTCPCGSPCRGSDACMCCVQLLDVTANGCSPMLAHHCLGNLGKWSQICLTTGKQAGRAGCNKSQTCRDSEASGRPTPSQTSQTSGHLIDRANNGGTEQALLIIS